MESPQSEDTRKLLKALYQPWYGIADALGHDVSDLVQNSGFPQPDGEAASAEEVAKPAIDVLNTQLKQFSAMSEALSGSGSKVWDQLLSLQEQQIKAFTGAFDQGLRGFMGVDQDTALKALSSDWSPAHVALRSLGVNDDNGLKIANEIAFCMMAWTEAQNASMKLNKTISDAWLHASHEFSVAITDLEEGDVDISEMGEFHRLWVKTAEPILQNMLRSDEFCEAQADFVRKSTRHVKLKSQLLNRFAETLELPGRNEINAAYEAIQELRRDVRSLRMQVRKLKQDAAPKSRATKTSQAKKGAEK